MQITPFYLQFPKYPDGPTTPDTAESLSAYINAAWNEAYGHIELVGYVDSGVVKPYGSAPISKKDMHVLEKGVGAVWDAASSLCDGDIVVTGQVKIEACPSPVPGGRTTLMINAQLNTQSTIPVVLPE
jgi:hypothetical protein